MPDSIGTITITDDDIEEIEKGGCVVKDVDADKDGVRVNVVYD